MVDFEMENDTNTIEQRPYGVNNNELPIENGENDSEETIFKLKKNQRRKCFQKIGGFDLISRRPMIDSQNEQIFVVSGSNIRQYSTSTGSFQGDFSFENRSHIVSLTINPNNNREYIVVDEDGLLIQWNYEEHIKTNEAYLPLGGKKITYFEQIFDEYYFVIPTRAKNAGQIFYTNRMCLNQQYMALCRDDFVNINAHQSVCFGPTEMPRYCASIYESQLMIYEIPVKIKSQFRKHQYDCKNGKTLSCVAFHPIEDCIATGDSKGMIVIWNGLLQLTPTHAIFHWHSQLVNDIAFSLSGTHLFSGGAEMVLVKWNLIGQNYGKKDFLPRLGMPIKLITVDPEQELIVASLEDQTLVIIDGQMNSGDKIIEGLTNGCNDSGSLTAGLHYSSKNKALVLNGRVGHIQFYSPSQQKLITQLDISDQNIVSAVSTKTDREIAFEKKVAKKSGEKIENYCNKLFPINVTKLAISDKGEWMATIEYRNDGKAFMENRLKFWNFRNSKFHLVTVVQLPHLEEITFINFSPNVPSILKNESELSELHFVTCSKDGSFQIWDLTSSGSRQPGWVSEKVGSLDHVSIPRMAFFSHDSTLLVVVFGNIITLWKNSHKGLQLIPRDRLSMINKSNAQVKLVKFGIGFKTYFLLLATEEEVLVFDTLRNFEVLYSYKASHKESFESVNFDVRNNIIAIITGKSLKFLELNQKRLSSTISLNSGTNFSGKVVATCFGTDVIHNHLKVYPNLEFYLMNDRSEIFHVVQLSDGEKLEKYQSTILVSSEEINSSNKFLMTQSRKKFESELSKVISSSVKESDCDEIDSKKNTNSSDLQNHRFNVARLKLIEKFFDSVPTHVMPDPTIFDEPYLEALSRIQEELDTETDLVEDDAANKNVNIDLR